MNSSAIARHYDNLTPEERFRLIVAAGVRGDEAEQERLARAGGSLTFTVQDHAPYSHAFNELALLIFIELQEDAARYLDANARAHDDRDIFDDGGEEGEETDSGDPPAQKPADDPTADPSDDDHGEPPRWQRLLNLAFAAGYVLKTRAAGWKLFCERLTFPPFRFWERLPGYGRLRRALDVAEKVAFTPEGFLRWMNDVRPEGEAELTRVPITAEGVADATATLFRERVEWWGGSPGNGA
jgi:hypothetical protein